MRGNIDVGEREGQAGMTWDSAGGNSESTLHLFCK